MGFRFPDPPIILQFEDDEGCVGLEVKTRQPSLGSFLDMTALAAIGESPSVEDVAKIGQLLEGFAGVLLGWNIEREDAEGNLVPVPANLDGLRMLKFADAFRIISVWIRSTAGVAAPLESGSSDGVPSEVRLPPMEPLSASLAS